MNPLPRRWAACLGLLLMMAIGSQAANAETRGSRHALPDLSGWWVPQYVSPNAEELAAENPLNLFDMTRVLPLKADALRAYRALLEKFNSGEDTNAAYKVKADVYCRPFRFNGIGLMGTDPESELEFLFTPGRVTLADELGHLRRIFIGGTGLSGDFGETNTGVSIGRWEGQTLLVETTGLSSQAGIAFFDVVTLGKNAHVTERIFLKRKDVLQVDSVIAAPDVLTAPYELTILYQRDHGHVPHEFSYCNEYDRSIDPITGHQRLDFTPPTDLPPPPKE